MLEKFARVLVEQLDSLAVEPQKCSRVRSTLSRCQRCLDVCPANGISWENKDLEVKQCIECGLCSAVCPTGALRWKSPSLTKLVERSKELINNYQEAVIYCSHSSLGKKSPVGIELPCLGAVPWEGWLELILSGNDKLAVYLPEDCCKGCSVKRGFKIWREQLTTAEVLAGKKITIVQKVQGKPAKRVTGEINTERRHLFNAFFGRFSQIPSAVVNGTYLGEKETSLKAAQKRSTHNERHKLLLGLIRRYPELAARVSIKQPLVDDRCQFCRACSILCPQGALGQTVHNGKVELILDNSLCSGCGLCTEICYHKSILLEESRVDLALPRGIALAFGYEQVCDNCGTLYVSSQKEDDCPDCSTDKSNLF